MSRLSSDLSHARESLVGTMSSLKKGLETTSAAVSKQSTAIQQLAADAKSNVAAGAPECARARTRPCDEG